MAAAETLILRVALDGQKSIYRDIEIEAEKSLYALAEAIVGAFGFDFDHAFGFYTGLTPTTYARKLPKYELFSDMGEPTPGAQSVKKTKIVQAFPALKHQMLFLFDYGDDWMFRVTLREMSRKAPKTKYPRVVASQGEAPEQYPDFEELESDGPRYGINLATGEMIEIGKSDDEFEADSITHFPAPSGIKAPPLSFAARSGDLLFISGIPGFDAQGNLPATFEAQFANVVINIKRILDEAGATMRDLVKVNVLLTRASDVAPMNALYASAFGPAPYPARTTCVVVALPNPAMLIEIEAVAAVKG
jgi:2-iminobutanoate/2-iminopropanoate deaminase